MNQPKAISIVIPAYNEEARLPSTLSMVVAYARTQPDIAEVIVVDDGSSDATSRLGREFEQHDSLIRLISYWPNGGKGYAVRRGVMEARGDAILISDADLSTPIAELTKLKTVLENADVVIGSRAVDTSLVRLRQAWYRQAMGKAFNRIMRMLTGLPYRDTQCGFKLLRRDAAKRIFSEAVIDRFAFDVEMLILAHRLGYRVVEVPVLWFNSPASRVHIIRDSLRMLFDISRVTRRLGRVRRDAAKDPRQHQQS